MKQLPTCSSPTHFVRQQVAIFTCEEDWGNQAEVCCVQSQQVTVEYSTVELRIILKLRERLKSNPRRARYLISNCPGVKMSGVQNCMLQRLFCVCVKVIINNKQNQGVRL